MRDRNKLARKEHQDGKTARGKEAEGAGLSHAPAETDRSDSPGLEGGIPLPEELTGRASGTGEDLGALFDDQSAAHLADGFHGGSGDDPSPVDQADGAGAEEEEDGA